MCKHQRCSRTSIRKKDLIFWFLKSDIIYFILWGLGFPIYHALSCKKCNLCLFSLIWGCPFADNNILITFQVMEKRQRKAWTDRTLRSAMKSMVNRVTWLCGKCNVPYRCQSTASLWTGWTSATCWMIQLAARQYMCRQWITGSRIIELRIVNHWYSNERFSSLRTNVCYLHLDILI